jgi:hypothetical protein
MINLVESIMADDLLSASEIFENRLAAIMEKKLYEKKKMMQAEVFGGLSLAQIQARKELGWKKAADVLGDPDVMIKSKKSKLQKRPKPIKRKKKIIEDINRDEVEAEKAKLIAKGMAYPEYNFDAKKEKAKADSLKKVFGVGMKSDNIRGNSPSAMFKRFKSRMSDKIKSTLDKTPAAPGSAVVNTTKYIAKKVPGAIGRVAGEIASYSNLEEQNN